MVHHDAILDARASVLGSAASVLAVWTLLALGSLLAPALGASAAVAISFSAATVLVLATCDIRRAELGPFVFALGVASGFVSYPAWVAGIATLGLALGFAPHAAVAPGAGDGLLWLSTLLLAPVFEELLYRQEVLHALRPSIGALPAILVSSALFAVPHLEPWSVLGTFLVGLALGTAFVATESIGLCIALHAGLNLAALVCGSPPLRASFAPLPALLIAGALFTLVWTLRRAPAFSALAWNFGRG